MIVAKIWLIVASMQRMLQLVRPERIPRDFDDDHGLAETSPPKQ
jgi:hypothetical protein